MEQGIETYEELKESDFFCRLSVFQGLAVCRAGRLEFHQAGSLVHRVGDIVSSVSIICNGTVTCYRYTEETSHHDDRKQENHSRIVGKPRDLKISTSFSARSKAQFFLKSCARSEGILFHRNKPDGDSLFWIRVNVLIDEMGDIFLQNHRPGSGGVCSSEANDKHYSVRECTGCESLQCDPFIGNMFPFRVHFQRGPNLVLAADTEEERAQWLNRFTQCSRDRDRCLLRFLATQRPTVRLSRGQCLGQEELDDITPNTCLSPTSHSSTAVCADGPVTLLVLTRTQYLQIVRRIEPVGQLQRLMLVRACELFRAWNRSSLLDVAKALALIHTPAREILCSKGAVMRGIFIVYHGAALWCDTESADGSESRTMGYGEFVGLWETLWQAPAAGFLVAQPAAYLFLLPSADFHRICRLQNDAIQAAYRLLPREASVAPASLRPPDSTARVEGGAGPSGADRRQIFALRDGVCARAVQACAASRSEGIPRIGTLLLRVAAPGPSGGGDASSPSAAAAPGDPVQTAPADDTGSKGRSGPPGAFDNPGCRDLPARLDFIRRQLGRSFRACTPRDAGLVAAARARAHSLHRPRPPPACMPKIPVVDLTEVVRCGGRPGSEAPVGSARVVAGPGEQELVRSMRAVLACRGGAASPHRLVKDLVRSELETERAPARLFTLSAAATPAKLPGGHGADGGGVAAAAKAAAAAAAAARILRLDRLANTMGSRPGDAEADLLFLFRGLAVPRHGVLVLPGAGRAFVVVEGEDDALAALNRAALVGLAVTESSLEELAAAVLANDASPAALRAVADPLTCLASRRSAGHSRATDARLPASARAARPGWAGGVEPLQLLCKSSSAFGLHGLFPAPGAGRPLLH